MNDIEKFYLAMGFLDCLEMSAQEAPKPEQARMKRMYVQEKIIPDILPNVPKEEILRRLDEIKYEKLAEHIVLKYLKPKVDEYRIMDVIKKGQFTSLEDLK